MEHWNTQSIWGRPEGLWKGGLKAEDVCYCPSPATDQLFDLEQVIPFFVLRAPHPGTGWPLPALAH